MTTREALLAEIENAPEPMLGEVLDFAKFLRAKLNSAEASAERIGETQRRWSDLRGALPCPAFGEDAQKWVSRSRRESDAKRTL